MRYSVEEAMLNLCLDKHGYTEIHWTGVAENYDSLEMVKRTDGKELKFTWAEVQEKQKVLDKEFADAQYQRDRKAEYDALNQLELMSDDSINGTTTHKDAIVAIKAKWPKDNSGPV